MGYDHYGTRQRTLEKLKRSGLDALILPGDSDVDKIVRYERTVKRNLYRALKWLERIQAALLAINSADDLINPPELRVLEQEIKRVKRGEAIVLPYSDQTVGHGSHTKAVLWEKYLARLLKKSERK